MNHLTEAEMQTLRESETVADMLQFLQNRFDLSIMPTPFQRTMVVTGLCQAVELLKSFRKEKRRKRITTQGHEIQNN